MDARRVHASYERFVGRFLLPLCAGGPVRVGRPVAPATLDYFETASPLDPETQERLDTCLLPRAGEVAPAPASLRPDRGTWALAMAAHDLLALTDPALDRWGARRARPVVLRWIDALVEQARRPATRAEVLGRHAVVSRLLEVHREDVTVRYWAGTRWYAGRAVPSRVRAWPRVRRVREERALRSVEELCRELDTEEGLELGRRFDALVARSPVTKLLRLDPDTFGAAALDALGDDRVRHGVAWLLAARGLDVVEGPLALAIDRLAQADAPEEGLERARRLAVEVHRLATQDGRTVEVAS